MLEDEFVAKEISAWEKDDLRMQEHFELILKSFDRLERSLQKVSKCMPDPQPTDKPVSVTNRSALGMMHDQWIERLDSLNNRLDFIISKVEQ